MEQSLVPRKEDCTVHDRDNPQQCCPGCRARAREATGCDVPSAHWSWSAWTLTSGEELVASQACNTD